MTPIAMIRGCRSLTASGWNLVNTCLEGQSADAQHDSHHHAADQ
eukprot:CAMPEP_0181200268 /NCGR_PEP_ID=MMETSP1096-20121128/17665_1 /TAXON_ID=156174 ORGANISM="Chrysochromulina ericina, Strain CCMP281" /NCGR_SAMPLE_ID=MMETSP1096 /ASSEMBLY_ACC=CAM_ASM_000453 /LENGTH=43 /DNA_ID= /DNA_START= /DNA_END= /DNA_ORIENTATION=